MNYAKWSGRLACVFIPVLVGFAFSILETRFLMYTPSPQFVVWVQIFDIGVNLIVGLLILGVYSLAARRAGRAAPVPFVFAALVTFNIFVYALVKVNEAFPNFVFLHPVSLALDAVLFVICLGMGYGLLHVARRVAGAVSVPPGAALGAMAVLLAALAAGDVFVLTRPPGIQTVEKAQDAVRAKAPNVMIFMIDAMRYDRMHINGNPRDTTTNIDKVYSRSVVFTRAFSQAPWTKPSIGAVFTGLYPPQHTAVTYESGLPAELLTFPEVFQRYGYDTAAFSANINVTPTFGFDQGFDHFFFGSTQLYIDRGLYGSILQKIAPGLMRRITGNRSSISVDANVILTRAGEWLARREQEGRPFFMYVHLNDLHDPYDAPAPYTYMYLDKDAPSRSYIELASSLRADLMGGKKLPLDEPRLRAMAALYDAQLKYVDDQLGAFLADLKKRGALDNTLLVFFADHGEDFGDHMNIAHGRSLYNSLLHAPLFFAFPDRTDRLDIDNPAPLFAIMPTIADYAHAPAMAGIPAPSLMPVISGRAKNFNPDIYSHNATHGIVAESLIQWPWKYIRSKKSAMAGYQTELYNIAEDFDENKNLVSQKQDLAKRLAARMQEIKARGARAKARSVDLDKGTRDKLKDLGYVK